MSWQTAANISLLAAAGLAILFTGLYGFRSNWRANRIGKVFLVHCVLMGLVLAQIVLAWWDPDYPARQHVRFIIYAGNAVAYMPMIWTLWREQRRDRDRRVKCDNME